MALARATDGVERHLRKTKRASGDVTEELILGEGDANEFVRLVDFEGEDDEDVGGWCSPMTSV